MSKSASTSVPPRRRRFIEQNTRVRSEYPHVKEFVREYIVPKELDDLDVVVDRYAAKIIQKYQTERDEDEEDIVLQKVIYEVCPIGKFCDDVDLYEQVADELTEIVGMFKEALSADGLIDSDDDSDDE